MLNWETDIWLQMGLKNTPHLLNVGCEYDGRIPTFTA